MDDGKTHLGYISGEIDGTNVKRVMVDSGSLSKLISPEYAKRFGLMLIPLKDDYLLKMANDSTAPILNYVIFPFTVGGILSVIRAFVVGFGDSYDLLLSKAWLRRTRAVVDFATDQVTLTGTDGL